ncbi:MAG: hypothetical protein BHV77_19370 [Bacteroides sp. 43_108]|nr:MAG: hypothetical protein BHV77_19370 [Bacteroides sp. 43_108]
MKNSKNMHMLLIRYGISIVLALMLVVAVYMLRSVSIDKKISVEVFLVENERCLMYVDASVSDIDEDSCVDIYMSENTRFKIRVAKKHEGKNYDVYSIVEVASPLDFKKQFQYDDLVNGYMVTGQLKLMDLFFNKWIY